MTIFIWVAQLEELGTSNSKENRESRKERLSLVGIMATKVIRDRSKYTRKMKHKHQDI